MTPLMWAAARGSTEVVQQLLESGAAVDRRAADGSTALMLASANGFTEIVRALVLRGADVTAARGGSDGAPSSRSNAGMPTSPCCSSRPRHSDAGCCRRRTEGHDMVVRQVLAMGAPVNVADERGTTALMIAARNGDLGMLQALLSRGADASIRDSQGRTVFEWAEASPTTAKYVVAFLIERGVSKGMPRVSAPPPSPQVKASLGTLATVLARVPPASAPVQAAQRRANAALSRLQALSAKWPAESPDDYRDNLAGYIAALEAALKSGDTETLAATVDAVAEDLEDKLEHCTKSGGRLGGSVVVRVRTLQGGIERRSWQVFYMPRVFEAASNATPDLFPQLSSPTEEIARPGQIRDVGPGSGDCAARRTNRRQGWRGKEGAPAGSSRSVCIAAMTGGARLFGRHRRVWVTAGAVLLAATAAALVPQPPAISGAAAVEPWAFAALASAAIVTLAILPFLAWRAAARPRAWVAMAVVSLALGLASFAIGGYAQRACTARYGERSVVIGTDLTALGVAYQQANPELSSDDLLFDAAGVAERVWTPASIGRCAAFISSTYFLWVPFLAVCLVATAQAVPTSIMAPMRLGRACTAGACGAAAPLRRLHELQARGGRQAICDRARRRARSRRLPRGD